MDYTKMNREVVDYSPDFGGKVEDVIKYLQAYLPSEDEIEAGVVVGVNEHYDYDDIKQYEIVRYTPMTPEQLKVQEEAEEKHKEQMKQYKIDQLERLKKELGVN